MDLTPEERRGRQRPKPSEAGASILVPERYRFRSSCEVRDLVERVSDLFKAIPPRTARAAARLLLQWAECPVDANLALALDAVARGEVGSSRLQPVVVHEDLGSHPALEPAAAAAGRGRGNLARVPVRSSRLRRIGTNRRSERGKSKNRAYVREVTLVYRLARVPDWVDGTKPVTASRDAWPYFRRLEKKVREHLMALYPDGANMPMAVETLHVGSLCETPCCPGELFRTALHLGAAGIIVAHNHPSGVASPSSGDKVSFAHLKEMGRQLGFYALDSLIIVPGSYYSLADADCLGFVRSCRQRSFPPGPPPKEGQPAVQCC